LIEAKSNDAVSGDGSHQELSGSLEKDLSFIELLSKSETPLGVTQIANQLAAGKSGIHRILQMMKATGWIRQTPPARALWRTIPSPGLRTSWKQILQNALQRKGAGNRVK